MSSLNQPQSINPTFIKDGVKVEHNENCMDNVSSKNPMDGTVQGTKPHRWRNPV